MSYITELKVSVNADQEHEYRIAGYVSVPTDLNKGTGGPKIYLWYKRGSDIHAAITRIQFSFNDKMSEGLHDAKYTKIDKNLNEGIPGDKIYLWYFKGTTTADAYIIDLHVTTQADEEPDMFGLGWKRLACDLNRNAGGNRIHLWVMQDERMYISDITATLNCGEDATCFKHAYIRLDENTNKGVKAAPNIFIFYRLNKYSNEAIKDVKISASDVPGYIKVKRDLNEGSGGSPVFLWYSIYASNPPIQDLTLILETETLEEYKKARIPVIDQNINPQGAPEYVSYYQ